MERSWMYCKIKNRPLAERFWEKVKIRGSDECWNWIACKSSTGYGNFILKGKNCLAHRVAWELTNGKIPEGMDILHHCDNPPCCNPKCLFLGTQTDNMRDRNRKGRHNIGKVTNEEISEIRNLRQKGMLLREIAELYPISCQTVGRICSNVLTKILWYPNRQG